MGNSNPYFIEMQIDLASPVAFMKKHLLHKLKKRQIFKYRSSRWVHEKIISGLRECDNYQWKRYSKDSNKKMGRQRSTTLYHWRGRKKSSGKGYTIEFRNWGPTEATTAHSVKCTEDAGIDVHQIKIETERPPRHHINHFNVSSNCIYQANSLTASVHQKFLL